MKNIGNILVPTSASVADPTWLIRWSVRNPDNQTGFPFADNINSTGTRWQRFLIWLLTNSIRRSLAKGNEKL